ncbi:retrovirus-related pol polyprotein from transposon TNT 1-94 [Tanacetum coccineum]
MKVEESLNVTFDETPPPSKTSPLEDDDLVEKEAIEVSKTRPLGNNLKDNSLENNEIINIKESKSHPLENVIEPKNLNEALKDESWVFRNKLDEIGIVSRNKARLVAQGYNQQEGIDYDETYAPVARLESIRILLAYACALDFKLFQMDVKSAFLNGFINEEVYVAQPLGFIDFAKPNHVYRLKKALYGLKQAPKAWYDRLKAFLIKHDYTMGMKQTALAISTTEAEYVSAGKACQQALWMKQGLVDYVISCLPLGWVQPRLHTWRDKAGSPSTFEIGESSTTTQIHPVTGEPIQHTIPLLVVRIVRQEGQIYEIQDHMEELPLEQFKTMSHEIDGAYTSVEDIATCLEASEAREIRLGARVRALKDRFGPPGER